jgi:hypothetical protein
MMHLSDLILSIVWPLFLPWEPIANPVVFLYFGPETVLPVTSILAAVLGVVLLFWRLLVSRMRKIFRRMSGHNPAQENANNGLEIDASTEDQHQ